MKNKFAVVEFSNGGFDEVASYHRTRAAAVKAAARIRRVLREEHSKFPKGLVKFTSTVSVLPVSQLPWEEAAK